MRRLQWFLVIYRVPASCDLPSMLGSVTVCHHICRCLNMPTVPRHSLLILCLIFNDFLSPFFVSQVLTIILIVSVCVGDASTMLLLTPILCSLLLYGNAQSN